MAAAGRGRKLWSDPDLRLRQYVSDYLANRYE